MTKFDAQTIHWIKSTLCNDEYSSDEELVEHFINEGPMTKDVAEQWVKMREFYIGGMSLFQKTVAVFRRKQACPHCEATRMNVVIHLKTWWLECSGCGDILSEKEKHEFSMAIAWPHV